jgi:hypothetical protein
MTFGVAKKAHPIAVKVLDKNSSGTLSGVLAGMEWGTLLLLTPILTYGAGSNSLLTSL